VRQARCRSLPASESVVGHQTPRKGRPSPQSASGRTWVFGHDNLRRTMSTWEWQWLPCLAYPSARTRTGGSGPLDSSSGSRCSRRFVVDGRRARARVHPQCVIPSCPAWRTERVLPWRHERTRPRLLAPHGIARPKTSAGAFEAEVARGVFLWRTCPFRECPLSSSRPGRFHFRSRRGGGHRFRRGTLGSRAETCRAAACGQVLSSARHKGRGGTASDGGPRCLHRSRSPGSRPPVRGDVEGEPAVVLCIRPSFGTRWRPPVYHARLPGFDARYVMVAVATQWPCRVLQDPVGTLVEVKMSVETKPHCLRDPPPEATQLGCAVWSFLHRVPARGRSRPELSSSGSHLSGCLQRGLPKDGTAPGSSLEGSLGDLLAGVSVGVSRNLLREHLFGGVPERRARGSPLLRLPPGRFRFGEYGLDPGAFLREPERGSSPDAPRRGIGIHPPKLSFGTASTGCVRTPRRGTA
jgi:hypothetical protein